MQNGAFAAHDLTLKAKTAAFNELSNQKQQIDSILTSLKQEVDRVLATKRGLNEKIDNLDNAIVAMSNSLIVDLRLFIEQWESGVVAGGKDWIQANGQAMLNSTFQGENGPSIADPLTRWIHCRLPVVAGVPIAIADNTFCGVHDGIADATQKIDAAEAKLLDKLRSVDPNGPLAYVIDQFRYLKEHGPVLAGEKTHELFEKLGNDPVGDIGLLGHAFHGVHKGDHDTINHQFAVDNSPNHKGLMKFENESFVKRIFFDMGFPENQEQEYFDVDTYAVMRNALNLMKLSLLESNEINRLLKTLGDSGEQYGKNGMTDILSPWLRSIDGNHQWLDVAPPYLRVEGKKDTLFEDSCNDVTNLSRRFKKPNAAGQDNFPMYKSDVFSKIFKGPLAPALEVVRDSFINRIPSNYLYKVTAEFPFPALNITCN